MMLAAMRRLPGIALLALIACTALVAVIVAGRGDGLEAEVAIIIVPVIIVIVGVVGLITIGPAYSARRDFKRRQEELPTLLDEMEASSKQKESERGR